MQNGLRRAMGLSHTTAMVVGIILGASIFVQPSEITRLVPSARGLIAVWLAAGALTFCGALVCAELSAIFPQTGGVYCYLKEIFSPALAFLWAWAMFWSMHSGIIAAIAAILARYVGYFIPLSELETRALAVAVILLLSAVNYLGIEAGSRLQVALTTVKVAAIVVMTALLFGFGGAAHAGAHGALPLPEAATTATPAAYALAIAAGLFAFGGWHMVTYCSGETRSPVATIPRALLLGTAIVTVCYILLNAAYLYVLPLSVLSNSARVAADATERTLGTTAGGAIATLVIVSAAGSLNGIILAGPRVYYAAAHDGLAFRWLGAVHATRRTPHLAIAAQAVWASVLVASNSYRQLFTRVVYTEWLFFALLAVGLFVLRRRGQYRPRFLAAGYLLLPVLFIFIVAATAIALNQMVADPRGSVYGMALVLVGLPIYFFWSRFSSAQRGANAHH